MADPTRRFERMTDVLREQGFRLTPQRVAIVRILSESVGHPNVEQIYEQVKKNFPTTSLATIYKTVSLLKGLGEVLELGFSDSSSRYDGNLPFPHPHVICTQCGRIEDFLHPMLDEVTRTLARGTGYEINNHRLDFFGICPKCLDKNQHESAPRNKKGT